MGTEKMILLGIELLFIGNKGAGACLEVNDAHVVRLGRRTMSPLVGFFTPGCL